MSTEQKTKVAYELVGNEITRTVAGGPAAVIATLIDGVCTIVPGNEQYRLKITQLLKGKEFKYAAAPEVAPEPVAAVVEEPVAPVTKAPVNPMAGLTIDQRKAINFLRSKEGFDIMEIESPAPAEPKKLSGHGDKTPAYVTWLLRYFPAKFAETYGIIGMGSVEKKRVVVDSQTGEKRMQRYREPGHVIARRATIYTDKQESADDIGTEGDV